MSLHWPFLLVALVFAGIAYGANRLQRFEWRTGDAYLFFWRRHEWSRDRHPIVFRGRIVGHWLFIAFAGAGALAFFVQFLGFVG